MGYEKGELAVKVEGGVPVVYLPVVFSECAICGPAEVRALIEDLKWALATMEHMESALATVERLKWELEHANAARQELEAPLAERLPRQLPLDFGEKEQP